MIPHISIKADVQAATRFLSAAAQKQVPFATARALTALAFEAQVGERAQAKRAFMRPRPFTVRAALVIKATKASQLATVYLRPEAARYLAPFEHGGVHALPGGVLLNPKEVSLDQYGQLRRGQVKTLLSEPDVFAGRITFRKSGQTVTGIWRRPPVGEQRQGGRGTKGKHQDIAGVRTGLELLIRLGSALPVEPTLHFVETAKAIVSARAATVFNQALATALATTRP